MEYIFDWDPLKARNNLKKHGVRFEDAVNVFRDPRSLTLYDEGHSAGEERWVTMGMIGAVRVCIVHHTFQEAHGGPVMIRIFSARRATAREEKQYWEGK